MYTALFMKSGWIAFLFQRQPVSAKVLSKQWTELLVDRESLDSVDRPLTYNGLGMKWRPSPYSHNESSRQEESGSCRAR